MLKKIEKLEKEYFEIQGKLADPAIIADHSHYTQLSRRYKSLENSAMLAKKYRDALKAKNDAQEIFNSENDGEMKDLALAELKDAEANIEKFEEEAKVELLPKDPNDQKDCII